MELTRCSSTKQLTVTHVSGFQSARRATNKQTRNCQFHNKTCKPRRTWCTASCVPLVFGAPPQWVSKMKGFSACSLISGGNKWCSVWLSCGTLLCNYELGHVLYFFLGRYERENDRTLEGTRKSRVVMYKKYIGSFFQGLSLTKERGGLYYDFNGFQKWDRYVFQN